MPQCSMPARMLFLYIFDLTDAYLRKNCGDENCHNYGPQSENSKLERNGTTSKNSCAASHPQWFLFGITKNTKNNCQSTEYGSG